MSPLFIKKVFTMIATPCAAATVVLMRLMILIVSLIPLAGWADTIYHCKAYNGGTFWTNGTCASRNALIDRIVTVPNGMPWDQQVQVAEGRRSAADTQISVVPTEPSPAMRCMQLKAERDKIWSRYSNWQFQPPEVVGPDRQRTLGIQAEQRALGCPTQ